MPTRRLMRAIDAGVGVNLPGVRPGLVGLLKSMAGVQPEGRPGSVKAVFESICENEFAFWSDVDPVAVRTELVRLDVEKIPFEGEVARVMRENVELKSMVEQERTASEAQQNEITTLRAQLGVLKQQLSAQTAFLEMGAASFATPYAKLLASWFPDICHLRLLGCDTAVVGTASVQALLSCAGGQAKTILFVKAQGGKVVSGGYLAPAWPAGSAEQAVDDPSGTSFVFSLTAPAQFPIKPGGISAALIMPPWVFGFGTHPTSEGLGWALLLISGDGVYMHSEGGMPQHIDTLGGRGMSVITGGEKFMDRPEGWRIRIDAWELWKVE
jgi:hypothetical protein